MLNKLKTTIAVVDSGIGGVSVLRELLRLYPNYNYIYFADNLFMPYGKRTKFAVKKRLNEIIHLLSDKYKVDEIIIACNTASSVLNNDNTPNIHKMKFYDTKTYLATPLTKKMLENVSVISDSKLAGKIEKYIFDEKRLDVLIKRHVKKLKLYEQNSIVLGCTHYELCYELFKKYCPDCEILKNSQFLLNNLKLDYETDTKPSILILLSKPSASYYEKINRLIRS